MSTVAAVIEIRPGFQEVFSATDLPAIGQLTLAYNEFNQRKQLNSSSTPPVSKGYAEKLTSTQTLDFTALVRSIGGTLDCTGLKLQYLQVNNLSTANTVTVEDGASNAYQVNGGADIVVPAGAVLAMFFNDKLADVAAGVKNLLFTATAGQSYQVMLLFG